MVGRLSLILGAFGITYAALLWRLYDIQILRGSAYAARIQENGVIPPERGVIFFTDKDGRELAVATTKDMPSAYTVPKEIEDVLETAHRLAPVVALPVEELTQQFKKPNDTYELIARKAPQEIVQRLTALNLKGVYVEDVAERFYPFEALAAHLVGYVGPKREEIGERGYYGVEEFYEKRLAGTAGTVQGGTVTPAHPGERLALTIDPNVQSEAERILSRVVKQHDARAGSVIVENPKTGEIIAMGSVPTFDPNSYAEAPVADFLNPVTQALYEPGSVFKVITMSAGIDAGKITPDTAYEDTGSVVVSGRKIQNWDLKAHGRATMANVIEKSINTGAVFAERQTGHATFTHYLKQFGFDEPTGVDLPGELGGNLRQLSPKAPAVAFATASFGQGVAVTPLELVNAIAAIANGGVLMRPYVNAERKPSVIRRVISSETAQTVTRMMVSAVDKAEIAKIEGYTFAGKTGTAFIPDFRRGGYTDRVINTYVGFGPTADPRFVILLKLVDPEGAPIAGLTVVPAFRDLAQFLVNYYAIPPDRVPER